MEKNLKQFIQDAVLELVDNGFSVTLSQEKHVVVEGSKCTGYLDCENKEFAIAFGHPDVWIEVFVHEYCHFQQCIQGLKFYDDERSLDEWLNGDIEMPYEDAEALTHGHMEEELDCEKRTVEMIKKYNLEIDTPQYIQKANTYILIYNVCLKQRRWIDKGPYYFPEIWQSVPDHWLDSYETVTPEFEKMVIEKCYVDKKEEENGNS